MPERKYRYPDTLTRAQRRWVNKVYPEPIRLDDTVEPEGPVEYHHILPVYYAMAILSLPHDVINSADNIVPLYRSEHRRLIHRPPHEVKELIEQGLPYWHQQYDATLRLIAKGVRMLNEAMGGELYPERKRK